MVFYLFSPLFFLFHIFTCFPSRSACLLNIVFCLSYSEIYLLNTTSYKTCWAMQVMYLTYIHCVYLVYRASSTAGNLHSLKGSSCNARIGRKLNVKAMICLVYSECKENRVQRIKCHINAVVNAAGSIGRTKP